MSTALYFVVVFYLFLQSFAQAQNQVNTYFIRSSIYESQVRLMLRDPYFPVMSMAREIVKQEQNAGLIYFQNKLNEKGLEKILGPVHPGQKIADQVKTLLLDEYKQAKLEVVKDVVQKFKENPNSSESQAMLKWQLAEFKSLSEATRAEITQSVTKGHIAIGVGIAVIIALIIAFFAVVAPAMTAVFGLLFVYTALQVGFESWRYHQMVTGKNPMAIEYQKLDSTLAEFEHELKAAAKEAALKSQNKVP